MRHETRKSQRAGSSRARQFLTASGVLNPSRRLPIPWGLRTETRVPVVKSRYPFPERGTTFEDDLRALPA